MAFLLSLGICSPALVATPRSDIRPVHCSSFDCALVICQVTALREKLSADVRLEAQQNADRRRAILLRSLLCLPERMSLLMFEDKAVSWMLVQGFDALSELARSPSPQPSSSLCPGSVAYIRCAIQYANDHESEISCPPDSCALSTELAAPGQLCLDHLAPFRCQARCPDSAPLKPSAASALLATLCPHGQEDNLASLAQRIVIDDASLKTYRRKNMDDKVGGMYSVTLWVSRKGSAFFGGPEQESRSTLQ